MVTYWFSANRTTETVSTADLGFRSQRDGTSVRLKSPSHDPGYVARNVKQVQYMVDKKSDDGLSNFERRCNDQAFHPCTHSMKRPREFVDDEEKQSSKQDGCEVFGTIFKAFDREGPFLFDSLENHEQANVDFSSMWHISCSQYQMKNHEDPKESSTLCLTKSVQSHRSNSTKLKTVKVGSHHTMQQIRTKKSRAELVSKRRQHIASPQKEKVSIDTRTFTSENPFCRVTMRPSYVSGLCILTFPNWFSKKYLKKLNTNVNLRVLDGRTWLARFAFGKYNVKLMKGWRNFVLDNHLEKDDMCIFELVDNNRIELKVSIFRVLLNPLQEKRISGQPKKSKCHASNLVKESHKTHGDKTKKPFMSDKEGKDGILEKNDAETHVMVDNNAEIGLSNSECQSTAEPDTPTMSDCSPPVRPLKSRKEMTEGRETHNISLSRAGGRFKVAQEKERLILAATGFTSANPFCVVTMSSSYVRGSFCLCLPKAFAEKYLRCGSRRVNLRVSNGGVWRAQCSAKEPRKLSSGWKKFVLDNHLKEDDACIFELIDRKHIELNVFIRHSRADSLQPSDQQLMCLDVVAENHT